MTGKRRLAFGAVLFTLLGLILAGLAGLGAVRADRPSVLGLPPRFPEFTMIREEVRDGVTSTYEFVYKNDHTWRHTLLEHDGDARRLVGPGHTVEHRAGQMIFTVAGETHSEDAPTDGRHSPGRWLTSPTSFKGWALARGAEIEGRPTERDRRTDRPLHHD